MDEAQNPVAHLLTGVESLAAPAVPEDVSGWRSGSIEMFYRNSI